MTYRWHLMGGVIAYTVTLLAVSSLYPITASQVLLWFFINLFGALFPDIDTKSKIRKIIYSSWLVILFLVLIALKINPVIIMLLAGLSILPLIVRHRTIFHNPVVLIGISSVLALITSIYSPQHIYLIITSTIFFISGTLSHLLLDKI